MFLDKSVSSMQTAGDFSTLLSIWLYRNLSVNTHFSLSSRDFHEVPTWPLEQSKICFLFILFVGQLKANGVNKENVSRNSTQTFEKSLSKA